MIIRHLHIDNFGIFHDFDLDLKPGLNHFVRDNEGGKSTLIEFIRRIFWGFPDKRSKLNPYPALNGTSKNYGGYLDVTMDDGREVRLERRGERGKLKLIFPDGESETVADIGSCAGLSESFYRNVFAVTIDELTAFAALDDPDVRNRLYGKALSFGGHSLSELQDQLKTEGEAIFRKRAVNTALKRLSLEFEESDKRLARASEALPAYEKAVLTAESIEEESRQLKKEIDALQIQITQAEEKLSLMESRRKLAADEEAFARQPAPEPLPEPLPSFDEKMPEAPAAPVFPELPAPPEEPSAEEFQGKCDPRRAVTVDEKLLNDVAAWCAEYLPAAEKMKSKKNFFFQLIAMAAAAAGIGMLFSSGRYPLLLIPGIILCGAGIAEVVYFFWSFISLFNRLEKSKKVKEDLLFRLAANPALPPEDLPELTTALQKYQAALKEYEKAQNTFKEKQAENEKLRFEYEMRRKLYDEKCADFLRRRQEYDRKSREFEEKCRSAGALLARYEAEKLALIKRRNELSLSENAPDLPETAPEELDELKKQCAALQEKLEEQLKLSGAERREAQLLLNGTDCAVELNVREQLRGKMRSAAEKYLILAAARKVLERSVERCENERQPELLQKASALFKGFTNNAYTTVYRQLSTNTLRVKNPDTDKDRAINELSRGTREQLFLALRLALIDSFNSDAETLPVVLDDVLVDFDTDRCRAVRQTLDSFAGSRQILLLEHS